MVTILQGKKEELYVYASENYTTDHHHVLYGTKGFAVPFLLFRSTIPFLRKHIDDQTIDALLLSHKTSISTIYECLFSQLNDEEKMKRLQITARLDSNITHSTIAKSDIIRSCAEILLHLYKRCKFSWIIPNVNCLDVNSLDLLKFIYQVYPEQAPDLTLGYDPDWENDAYDQNTGISLYHSLDTVTLLQSFVYAFEGIASIIKKIDLHYNSIAAALLHSFEGDPVLDKYDDNSEWEANGLLNSDTISPDTHSYILNAVQKCFRLFDFTGAMLLSQLTQKKLAPFLTKQDWAMLLHVEGLCAHNRHFFTQGNLPLANHLHQLFERALAVEINPSYRIALLYRLIVTLSRRKNDVKTAYVYANQAFEELNHFTGENKEILMAWINNVYSYMLMKEGDLTAAITKHEEAYYLLDKKSVNSSGNSVDEINYTKAVLAENLSTLNSQRGDFGKMKEWYKIETFYTDMWPSLSAVSSAEWQSFYYQQLKITQALSNAKQGLKKSRQSFNYILEYFFTVSLADIHNRLGKADEAINYYRKCLIFQKRIGHSYEQITFFALQLALIKLSIRSRQYEDALQLIEELNHAPIKISAYESIEILEQAALCYTFLDKITEAENYVNRAIELAVSDGDCHLLFKVNLLAGRVCQLLNRTGDAQNTYLQAQEISTTIANGVAFKAAAQDMVTLYLGILETGPMNVGLLTDLIRILADGLKKNIDCWWDLKRALHLISVLSIPEKKRITETSFYKQILNAALQRMDCLSFYENYSTIYTEI